MKNTTIAVTLVTTILFLAPTVTSLSISNPTSNIHLYGGESASYNITLTSDNPGITKLSYTIDPDPNGFTIEFSNPAFVLDKHESKTIEVTVHTLPHLKPDNYTITIISDTQVVKPETNTIYQKEIVYVSTDDPDPTQPHNLTDLLLLIENILDTRQNIIENISEIRDEIDYIRNTTDTNTTQPPDKVTDRFTPILLLFIPIAILLLLIGVIIGQKSKKQK